jgi:glycosyltransferase involved in cell wall biosynthesis
MPRHPSTYPRVLLLHYTSPPVVGGVEHVLAQHAQLLARGGFDVHVLVGRGKAPGAGVHFHRLGVLDSRHRRVLAVTRELEAGRVTPAFASLTAQIRAGLEPLLAGVDVCVVHNALTLHKNLALTAALHQLAKRVPTRFIAWCHDLAWTNPQYSAGLHPGAPWSLLRTPIPRGTYVTVSRDRQRELSALLGMPVGAIEVVPNGVDPGEFLNLTPTGRRLARTLRLWDPQVVLLLPVRITRRKHIEFALHVTSEMVRREMTVRLLVTGPPGPHNPRNREYLDELRALRHRLGLDEQVVFCAELHNPEGRRLALSNRTMRDLYLLADALLLPSRGEGFGLPLLEAGLTRLPAMTSDLASLREIGDDAILTFSLDDPPAGVAARLMQALMEDRGYRLRRRVLTSYTWEVIMRERIVPLLTQLAPVTRA